MLQKIKRYKKLIFMTFCLFMILLTFLTISAIYQTNNWKWFAVDFNQKDHIISSFGTLIGGILAFLSVLFVLYQVLEQREQILNEKIQNNQIRLEDLKGRIKVITLFLNSLIQNIGEQGHEMREFYEAELNRPWAMNITFFNPSGNFARILEMDTILNFNAISTYGAKVNWQQTFVNLYSYVDFYSEAIQDLKAKYVNHINNKVVKQQVLSDQLEEIISMCTLLIDNYKKIGMYHTHYWPLLMNELIEAYHKYLKECNNHRKATNFRHISDKIIYPFLEQATAFAKNEGYGDFGCRDIIALSANYRKKNNQLELSCKFYAENVERTYNKYYSPNNEILTELNRIIDELQSVAI